jgi:hypothetical protein
LYLFAAPSKVRLLSSTLTFASSASATPVPTFQSAEATLLDSPPFRYTY